MFHPSHPILGLVLSLLEGTYLQTLYLDQNYNIFLVDSSIFSKGVHRGGAKGAVLPRPVKGRGGA